MFIPRSKNVLCSKAFLSIGHVLDKSRQLGFGLDTKNTLQAFEDGNCAFLKCIVIVVIFPQSKVDIWQLAKDEKIIEPRLSQLRKNCGLYMNARGLILHK